MPSTEARPSVSIRPPARLRACQLWARPIDIDGLTFGTTPDAEDVLGGKVRALALGGLIGDPAGCFIALNPNIGDVPDDRCTAANNFLDPPPPLAQKIRP